MRAGLLLLSLLAGAAGAQMTVTADGWGRVSLSDPAPLAAVSIWAADANWAAAGNPELRDMQGRLPGTMTARLDLPGQAAGEALVTMTLEPAGELWRYTVAAEFSAATRLATFAIHVELPLARLLGGAVRGVPDGGAVAIGDGQFGTTFPPGAVWAETAGGPGLLVTAEDLGSVMLQDQRQWGGDTAVLRLSLLAGDVAAGTVARKSVLLGRLDADAALRQVRGLMPSTDYDPARPALLLNADGSLDLIGPGQRWRIQGELAAHGRGWALTSQRGGSASTSVTARTRRVDGSLPIAGADAAVRFAQLATAGDGSARVDYRLERGQPLAVNSHQLSLGLPLAGLPSRRLRLIGETTTELTIPERLGETSLANQRCARVELFVGTDEIVALDLDPAMPVLVQDNRAFGSEQIEVRIQFGGDEQTPLPPGAVDLALSIATAGLQTVIEPSAVSNRTDTADWFAYEMPWDAAPVDLSFLNDEVAGEHGFLTTRDGRFVFEDGTPARFWGTCFSAGANFPTHAQAEAIARRLARFGLNIVRTHHADAGWSRPSFFHFNGQETDRTSEFQPESLDRFDYLVACLKRVGIYVYLDQLVHRKFTPADGVDVADQLDYAAKPYSNFDPGLIAAQKAFSKALLEHVNPYTGLAYKDDPAIVLIEFANENDLMAQRVELEPFRSRLEQRYRAWAAEHGLTVPPGPVSFRVDADPTLRFLVEVQRDYYREMHAFLRELGVRVPLTGSNWSINAGLLAALDVCDYTDSHGYHGHPNDAGEVDNRPRVGDGSSMIQWLSFNRLAGKPFFVSEWDTPWPGEYRAELPLWMAAAAAHGDWNGLTVYTYRHSADVPVAGITGAFDTFNDPTRFGLMPAAALLFRRGDVAAGTDRVAITMPAERAVTAPSPNGSSTRALAGLPELFPTAVALGRAPAGWREVPFDQETPATPELRSSTGEVSRRLGADGYGLVDTPRSKAAYGMLGAAGELRWTGARLSVTTRFAAVALGALDAQPIATSRRLLLTAVARAENTGTAYNLFRTKVLNRGNAPILCEPVRGGLSFTTPHRRWVLTPLGPDGAPGAARTLTADGELTVPIGPEDRTIFWELRAE